MKHVYSKADETYSWLGREDIDGSNNAMIFLQTLLLANDNTLAADAPIAHTPGSNCKALLPSAMNAISTTLPPNSTDEGSPRAETCKGCLHEARFRALLDFSQRPYWRRRWIIQEIAVSPRVQIICGSVRMTLDEMKAAIRPCRTSCYWSSETEVTYSFIRRILEFRRAYQVELKLSLCRAIAMTQDSLSTDPRDSIFALLGICHDGAELVPTPNYQQPVEVIVRDISRALLRKEKYLEVVLINTLLETGSSPAPLPSWIPDGFTADMPEDSYILANKRLASYGKLCIPDTIGEHYHSFQVLGIIIGTIVAATSTISFSGRGESDGSQSESFDEVQLPDSSIPPTTYYASDAETVAALFSCLTKREDLTSGRRRDTRASLSDRDSGFTYRIRAHIVWHVFCLYLAGCDVPYWSRSCHPLTCFYLSNRKGMYSSDCLESGDKNLVAHGFLIQWLQANSNFMIQGRALKNWTNRRSFLTYMLRWLDSLSCLIFMFAMPVSSLVLSILYQDQVISTSSAVLGIVMLLAYIGAPPLVLVPVYRYKVFFLLRKIWTNMARIFKMPKKLVRSDKGAIGMACSATQSGDKICLLAGRTIPIVLREVRNGDQVHYVVVGEIYVYLSEADRKLYNGFLDQKTDDEVTGEVVIRQMRTRYGSAPKPWGLEGRSKEYVNARERARCVDKYRKEGILQSFELV